MRLYQYDAPPLCAALGCCPHDPIANPGLLMDGLVDDTRKKMEAPPKKTPRKIGFWSGRKTDSPKSNVVFSPETKVHCLDRDDMESNEMGHAVEEVEHENDYSEIG
ncbi:hypothetical protein Tco_0799092 [Tanacetum coccineum]